MLRKSWVMPVASRESSHFLRMQQTVAGVSCRSGIGASDSDTILSMLAKVHFASPGFKHNGPIASIPLAIDNENNSSLFEYPPLSPDYRVVGRSEQTAVTGVLCGVPGIDVALAWKSDLPKTDARLHSLSRRPFWAYRAPPTLVRDGLMRTRWPFPILAKAWTIRGATTLLVVWNGLFGLLAGAVSGLSFGIGKGVFALGVGDLLA